MTEADLPSIFRIPRRRALGVVVTLAAIVSVLGALALPAIGLFLVVADDLRPSDAILVLDGSTPARELEAAALYHRRYAPVVVVTLSREPVSDLSRHPAGESGQQERAVHVLRHAGVPATAIVRSATVTDNSAQELHAHFELAKAHGFRRVIIVTSAYHTRRVWLIWRSRYGGAVPALIHPTPYERFVAERWWRARISLEAGVHEMFGILNFYLGGPLRTFDDQE